MIQIKQTRRTSIVWKNGIKNITDIDFLFKLFDLCLKYEVEGEIRESIKQEIWSKRENKEVWPYIASKELEVSIFYILLVNIVNLL